MFTTVQNSLKSFVIPVAKRFSDGGFDVTLACNMDDAFYGEYSKEFHCVKVNIKRGFHLFNLIKTIWDLVKIFRQNSYDVVQYGTENAAFCGAIASWMCRVPVRIYEHWGARYVGYTGIMRLVSVIIEKTAAFFSTDVRQVSPKNMAMCVRDGIYPAEKVRVLGKGGTVGVDCRKFDIDNKAEWREEIRQYYEIPQDCFVFGFVGRFGADKGANELLTAFRRISEDDSSVRLMIVGPLEKESTLNLELYNWAEQSENVIFTGRVEDVFRYMSSFDTMVHPTYREGFGMVIQEAGALKLPVITTDIMGPAEIITDGENGLLVPSKNSGALEAEMRQMRENSELRENTSENLYKDVISTFESSVMVERIWNDRQDLLKERLGYFVETDVAYHR